MSRKLDRILDECQARLRAGESLESCLASYPEHSRELRPLLEMAVALQRTPWPQARPQAVALGEQRMLAAAAQKFRPQAVSTPSLTGYTARLVNLLTGKENVDMRPIYRFALAAMVALLLLGGGGWMTVASASALPGDTLYPLKTTFEIVRLLLTFDPVAQAQLEQQIQATRQQEVLAVIEEGRTVDVHFSGELTAIEADNWTIGGFIVYLDANTEIVGPPILGATVDVEASVQADGRLLGRRLVVEGTPAVTPTDDSLFQSPLPTHTPTHKLTDTPMPTRTMEPTHEPTEEPHETMEPTHEPTEEPHETETVESTHEPTDEPHETVEPTDEPHATPEPTHQPTYEPPHETPEPTHQPTYEPPHETPKPTEEPHSTPEPPHKETPEPTEEPDDHD